MTADDIDDDDDFPALREQLGCARLHPGTLCGKKPFTYMSFHQLIMILMLMLRWDWR